MSKNIDVLLIVTLVLSIAEIMIGNLISAGFIASYAIILHTSVRYYNFNDIKIKLMSDLHIFFIALISAKTCLGVFKHIGL